MIPELKKLRIYTMYFKNFVAVIFLVMTCEHKYDIEMEFVSA